MLKTSSLSGLNEQLGMQATVRVVLGQIMQRKQCHPGATFVQKKWLEQEWKRIHKYGGQPRKGVDAPPSVWSRTCIGYKNAHVFLL